MVVITKKFTLFVFIIFSLLGLPACSSPEQQSVPPLNFTKYPAIGVNVKNIEVVEAYKSPFSAPNIEHLMPYSPADAMAIWAKERLKAVGTDKLLQITIVDASVVEVDLPKTKGVKGVFTVDQDKRYDARIEVEMKIYGSGALSEASTSAVVTRSVSIPENASVNYRKATYERMVQDLMKVLNDKLENNMRNYMGNYLGF